MSRNLYLLILATKNNENIADEGHSVAWLEHRWICLAADYGSNVCSCVTRWEAPGGIGSSSGGWPTILLQYSAAVGWVFDL